MGQFVGKIVSNAGVLRFFIRTEFRFLKSIFE